MRLSDVELGAVYTYDPTGLTRGSYCSLNTGERLTPVLVLAKKLQEYTKALGCGRQETRRQVMLEVTHWAGIHPLSDNALSVSDATEDLPKGGVRTFVLAKDLVWGWDDEVVAARDNAEKAQIEKNQSSYLPVLVRLVEKRLLEVLRGSEATARVDHWWRQSASNRGFACAFHFSAAQDVAEDTLDSKDKGLSDEEANACMVQGLCKVFGVEFPEFDESGDYTTQLEELMKELGHE